MGVTSSCTGRRTWVVPSATQPGRVYEVRLCDDRRLECSCVAGLQARLCWHQAAVQMLVADQRISEQQRRERSVLRSTYRGRAELFG